MDLEAPDTLMKQHGIETFINALSLNIKLRHSENFHSQELGHSSLCCCCLGQGFFLPLTGIVTASPMAPKCKMLEAAAAKLKPKPETEGKDEAGGTVNPSRTKKLETEMEKKIKGMAGDTSLLKDPRA